MHVPGTLHCCSVSSCPPLHAPPLVSGGGAHWPTGPVTWPWLCLDLPWPERISVPQTDCRISNPGRKKRFLCFPAFPRARKKSPLGRRGGALLGWVGGWVSTGGRRARLGGWVGAKHPWVTPWVSPMGFPLGVQVWSLASRPDPR